MCPPPRGLCLCMRLALTLPRSGHAALANISTTTLLYSVYPLKPLLCARRARRPRQLQPPPALAGDVSHPRPHDCREPPGSPRAAPGHTHPSFTYILRGWATVTDTAHCLCPGPAESPPGPRTHPSTGRRAGAQCTGAAASPTPPTHSRRVRALRRPPVAQSSPHPHPPSCRYPSRTLPTFAQLPSSGRLHSRMRARPATSYCVLRALN